MERFLAILQTRDEYLWIGTQEGLARFDGRNFTVFDHVNGPAFVDDDCRTLAEDLEGNLWIGTRQDLFRRLGCSAPSAGNCSDGYPVAWSFRQPVGCSTRR